jgi:hypothetical protein
MSRFIIPVVAIAIMFIAGAFMWANYLKGKREAKNYERGLKMVTLLIHLPPSTDDVRIEGRDEREVTDEALSEAQVMYGIISSTVTKGFSTRVYGQKHISFEIVAHNGFIKYFTVVPFTMIEVIRQAIIAAYPTARLEEVDGENIFSETGGAEGTVGGEFELKKDFAYPIANFKETRRDAMLSILNAMSVAKKGDGIAIQVLLRPAEDDWTKKSTERVKEIKEHKKKGSTFGGIDISGFGYLLSDILQALWKPPEEREKEKKEKEDKPLTSLEQSSIEAIEEKTKTPGFEVLIRILASAESKARAEALIGGMLAAFSQFDSQSNNGFKYDALKDIDKLTEDYILRIFPQTSNRMVLNSVELSSIFHLPSQNVIPTSQVERQATKQVDGPTVIPEEGVLLGVNEFRGEQKEIKLAVKDRRRHTYIIGQTGTGKSGLIRNIAYQDMCDGKGFALIDPHGDLVDELMGLVPPERIDDVILFDPGDLDNPIGMNMFEFDHPDQKDFIIQEGINMLYSLFDPGHTGIFGPRGEHMFRNCALLLMADPAGGTFIDVPKVFVDQDYMKSKLKYVTDKAVYDYWTKEFPASQRSNESGEVTTWFVSKWGPFLSNTMMRNVMGQIKSGFNLREIMDNKKILFVNLSKGKMGELNSKLLGMIFVMKFQAAAMSRADIPEDQREDFCLFVDEFQNFATESFESILSEARKYRLNLVLANQFMTQLTDKIREAIIGNIGTVVSGRIGTTDAEILVKKFTPTFTAEDLTKLPNFQSITSVMIHNVPSAPFTMTWVPPMGDVNGELAESMREYSAIKYGRPRKEVEAEINARVMVESKPAAPAVSPGASGMGAFGGAGAPPMGVGTRPPAGGMFSGGMSMPGAPSAASGAPKSFLDSWIEKKKTLPSNGAGTMPVRPVGVSAPVMAGDKLPVEQMTVEAAVKSDTLVEAPKGDESFRVRKSESTDTVVKLR